MYKYIGSTNTQSYLNARRLNSFTENEDGLQLKRYLMDCNHADQITRREDGGILEGWKLEGLLLLTRHGDRGPMSHVSGIDRIDCSGSRHGSLALYKYKTFLSNGSAGTSTGHFMWSKSGPFHNFPLLPPFPKSCLLGQLTYRYVHILF